MNAEADVPIKDISMLAVFSATIISHLIHHSVVQFIIDLSVSHSWFKLLFELLVFSNLMYRGTCSVKTENL